MANTKKMTKRDYFNKLLTLDSVKANDELVKFIEHELELLAKKNASGADRKPTAVQIANMGIKENIINGMNPNQLYTITDLIKNIAELNDLSNQRVSALVRQLMEDGKVVRIEDKRKAYFRL